MNSILFRKMVKRVVKFIILNLFEMGLSRGIGEHGSYDFV